MKIESLELLRVPPRWLFLKVSTDKDIVGWGEPVVEGRAATVEAAVREMSGYLIGADPRRVEDIWQALYRGGFYRGGPVLMSAIAGIDQALWDIKGKALGVPIYELLGGPVRERVRVYRSVGKKTPEELGRNARQALEEGFSCVKTAVPSALAWVDSPRKADDVVERVAAIRAEVGDELDIAIDFHGRVHKGMAKKLIRDLEPFAPFFIEEPVLSDNPEAMAALQKETTVPIAAGERIFSRWGFKRFFELGALDIAQPDLSHAGGISEVRRVAAMAEAYDVALAPHCPLGPIALAASLQIDLASPNAVIQEMVAGLEYSADSDVPKYLKNPDVFRVEEGHIARLDGPGLGIEIDEEAVREAAKEPHDWKNPVWRAEDGSVTEW